MNESCPQLQSESSIIMEDNSFQEPSLSQLLGINAGSDAPDVKRNPDEFHCFTQSEERPLRIYNGRKVQSRDTQPRKRNNRRSSSSKRVNETGANASQFEQAISQKIIRTIYHTFTQDSNVLNRSERSDINTVLRSKAQELHCLLERHTTSSVKLKVSLSVARANKERDRKIEKIRGIRDKEALRNEETKQIQRFRRKQRSIQEKLRVTRIELDRERRTEMCRKYREVKKYSRKKKKLITENITNYYDDKISELKEHIGIEKRNKRTLEIERKEAASEYRKHRKGQRKTELEKATWELKTKSESLDFLLDNNAGLIERNLLKAHRFPHF